jgi:hypothetical protein
MEATPPAAGVQQRAARVAEQMRDHIDTVARAHGVTLSATRMQRLQYLADRAATATDAAESFMALDEFKRELGRLRGAAQSGRLGMNAGQMAEDLETAYEVMRRHLEDASVWGERPAAYQREMNAAFTPMIRPRGALERRFMEEDPHNRSVNGWDQALRARRGEVAGVLNRASLEEGLNERADLLRGAQRYSDWAETMQRLHAGDTSAAQQMQQETQRLLSAIERLQTDVRAAQLLEQAASGVPQIGGDRFGTNLPKMVRMLQRFRDNPRAVAGGPPSAILPEIFRALSFATRQLMEGAGQPIVSREAGLVAGTQAGADASPQPAAAGQGPFTEEYLRSLGMEPEPELTEEYLRSLGLEPEENP